MAIKMMDDVGAPLAVAGIDIASKATMPQWNNWIIYGVTGLGYLASVMGWGGNFIKQMGVSSLPLTAERIYAQVMGGAVSERLAYRARKSVGRYPAPAYDTQFQGTRITKIT